jgi:hypothetical protein
MPVYLQRKEIKMDVIRTVLQNDGTVFYFEYGEEGDLYRIDVAHAFNSMKDGAEIEIAIADDKDSQVCYENLEPFHLTKI